jgi:hypothetical protein
MCPVLYLPELMRALEGQTRGERIRSIRRSWPCAFQLPAPFDGHGIDARHADRDLRNSDRPSDPNRIGDNSLVCQVNLAIYIRFHTSNNAASLPWQKSKVYRLSFPVLRFLLQKERHIVARPFMD